MTTSISLIEFLSIQTPFSFLQWKQISLKEKCKQHWTSKQTYQNKEAFWQYEFWNIKCRQNGFTWGKKKSACWNNCSWGCSMLRFHNNWVQQSGLLNWNWQAVSGAVAVSRGRALRLIMSLCGASSSMSHSSLTKSSTFPPRLTQHKWEHSPPSRREQCSWRVFPPQHRGRCKHELSGLLIPPWISLLCSWGEQSRACI